MSEKNEKDTNDDSSSKGKTREAKESGSSTLSKMKHCVMNKITSGGKDMCPRSFEKEMATKNKEVTFIVLQKNMRSVHSSGKIEEMVSELEGYRWDAILLNETWRHEQAEIWETHHKHIFMGVGKFDNKHGVGIMLNRRWRQRIIDTEYISERAITTTILVNQQRIKLMSVYFHHSKNMRTTTLRGCTKQSRNTWRTVINTFQSLEETSMLSWDLEKERNAQVLASTL